MWRYDVEGQDAVGHSGTSPVLDGGRWKLPGGNYIQW